MVMKSGIYRITCLSNGKCYIGSSCDIRRRWREHKYALTRNQHSNRHLQRAWDKYGGDSFVFSIILLCSEGSLLQKEQEQLDTTRRPLCFNISFIAGRLELTEEVRSRIGESKKGNKYLLGYTHTQETKERLRHAQRGINSPTCKLTEDQVISIREDTRFQREIAEEYGISREAVSGIKCGRNWKHI